MSGRLLDNFMQAVHAQRFEKPLASEIERNVDDMLRSDFGRKLWPTPRASACSAATSSRPSPEASNAPASLTARP